MSLAKPSTSLGADMLDVSGFNVSTESRGEIIERNLDAVPWALCV